jgi:hypothetical protein
VTRILLQCNINDRDASHPALTAAIRTVLAAAAPHSRPCKRNSRCRCHYLIDIIAGTAIAVLAIVVARRAGQVIAKWQVRSAAGALVPAAVPAE